MTRPASSISLIKCWYPLQSNTKLRKFIRHPADVPIRIALDWVADNEQNTHPCDNLENVSVGGLAFNSPKAPLIGQSISVSYPLLDQHHSQSGKVAWNNKVTKGFDIGLQFEEPETLFKYRMIEQICYIQNYRSLVKQQQGRQLSSRQAAQEWISLYAKDFPGCKS